MKDDGLFLLSKLVDGDAVDPNELAEILEHSEGRAALVDLVAIRSSLKADQSVPSEDFYRKADGILRRPFFSHVIVSIASAAAALLFAAVLVFSLRLTDNHEPVTDSEPPKADRIVIFEEGVDWNQINGGR